MMEIRAGYFLTDLKSGPVGPVMRDSGQPSFRFPRARQSRASKFRRKRLSRSPCPRGPRFCSGPACGIAPLRISRTSRAKFCITPIPICTGATRAITPIRTRRSWLAATQCSGSYSAGCPRGGIRWEINRKPRRAITRGLPGRRIFHCLRGASKIPPHRVCKQIDAPGGYRYRLDQMGTFPRTPDVCKFGL